MTTPPDALQVPVPYAAVDMVARRAVELLIGDPAALRRVAEEAVDLLPAGASSVTSTSAPQTTTAWLTRRQAAEHASLSLATLDRQVKLGLFRRHNIEGRPLFDRAELDEDIRNR